MHLHVDPGLEAMLPPAEHGLPAAIKAEMSLPRIYYGTADSTTCLTVGEVIQLHVPHCRCVPEAGLDRA